MSCTEITHLSDWTTGLTSSCCCNSIAFDNLRSRFSASSSFISSITLFEVVVVWANGLFFALVPPSSRPRRLNTGDTNWTGVHGSRVAGDDDITSDTAAAIANCNTIQAHQIQFQLSDDHHVWQTASVQAFSEPTICMILRYGLAHAGHHSQSPYEFANSPRFTGLLVR